MKRLPMRTNWQLANLKSKAFQTIQWHFHINRLTTQVYRESRIQKVSDNITRELGVFPTSLIPRHLTHER